MTLPTKQPTASIIISEERPGSGYAQARTYPDITPDLARYFAPYELTFTNLGASEIRLTAEIGLRDACGQPRDVSITARSTTELNELLTTLQRACEAAKGNPTQ